MIKYELIPEQLIYEGSYSQTDFFEPGVLSEEYALKVHDATYIRSLKELTVSAKDQRRIGFPVTQRLVEREFIITQGTVQCGDFALQHGISLNVAGGTHHAFSDHGEGFCLLNDVAVAARYLLDSGKAGKILVIDLDVHQGNGTAQIFTDEPSVFTFSMHGKDNYPHHKEKSDLDIELPTGTTDATYLSILKDTLKDLIQLVRPDFLFYVAGVDILAGDKLGKLSVSAEGCRERDRLVISCARQYDIPLVITMGGGYAPRIATIVDAHCTTFRLAKEIFE